jgi:membrane-associated phospholipid phosphatase
VVLAVASVVVFADGWRGPGLAVTAVDTAVVGWLAGLRGPGLTGAMQALAALGSWTAITVLLWGLLAALLVLRRLRQLLVVLMAWILQGFLIQYLLAPLVQRPRPFGVVFRGDWYAWALPAQQLASLAMLLVGVLYGLVPEGRWRQVGKRVATAVVALVAVGRIALGADAPTDVLVGVAIGVAVPLLGFRWFTPNEVFPITYRRGSGAPPGRRRGPRPGDPARAGGPARPGRGGG